MPVVDHVAFGTPVCILIVASQTSRSATVVRQGVIVILYSWRLTSNTVVGTLCFACHASGIANRACVVGNLPIIAKKREVHRPAAGWTHHALLVVVAAAVRIVVNPELSGTVTTDTRVASCPGVGVGKCVVYGVTGRTLAETKWIWAQSRGSARLHKL